MDEPLHDAVRMGDADEVSRILLQIHTAEEEGGAEGGAEGGVEGGDDDHCIDRMGSLMWTALHEAVSNGRADIVRLLLSYGGMA